MSSEEHKALVREGLALIDEGRFDQVADRIYAPDYRLHLGSAPEVDREHALGLMQGFVTAFPGIRHEVVEQIAEGDLVATRLVIHGTHTGDFMGMPPTGREVTFSAINLQRIAGGRVVEHWIDTDLLGLMQQLGMIPAPEAAAT